MKKLCVVPCGKTKIWSKDPKAGPTPARMVYIGPFASTCRKYAEHFYPNSYMILSAKYGLLAPNDGIPGDYNVTFNDPSTNPITADQLRIQVDKKGLRKYDCIIVLGGRRYVDMLEKAFVGKKIVNPLEGCSGNGEMMSVLLQAIQRNKPLVDC
jgi:hypothetical protein